LNPYPLLFHPILKEKIWGGRSLADLGKSLPPGTPIGESWELADLPDSVSGGRSRIANGPMAGRTLREAIADEGPAIMGGANLTDEGGFPLLVKFLDARENLSVQVHPDQAYVQKHPEAILKSESWIVVRASPGAVIYKGVRPEVTAEMFARHVADGTVVDDLIALPVAPGECHYLPSGTCHALGAGIVVAEIQTPSDTTFRIYDWGRTGRALHLEQALECIDFGAPPLEAEPPDVPVELNGLRTTILVRTGFFTLERLETDRALRHRIETSGMPEVWLVLAGGGLLETPDAPTVPLSPGTTVLLPAALRDTGAQLAADTVLIRTTLPSPLEGLIA